MKWRSCTAVLGLLLGVSRPAIAVEHYGYALVDPASGEVTGYNSRGGRIEVTRYDREAGVSVVTFRRLADPRFGGNVQVTAAGFNEGLAYCKIRSWDSSGADVQITVACYDMVSRLPMQQRHKYSVLYLADHEPNPAEAPMNVGPMYLWTASATAPIAVPERYAVSDPRFPIRVRRTFQGHYEVTLNTTLADFETTVLVTSYGPDNRYCQIDGLLTLGLKIVCAGDLPFEDSQFTVLMLKHGLRDLPAARAMVTSRTTSRPVFFQSYVTSGGSVSGSGQWLVVSPDLPHGERDQNAVFMTPNALGYVARCRPDSWGRSPPTATEPRMNIKPECFDQSGAPVEATYHMLVLGPPTPIRAAPVVSPTPVATTLCGPPDDGRPAPDPTLERYFVARGDYPADANPGWHQDAMGLAHDNTFWYVTQFRRVWQIRPDRLDNARCDFDGVQCTTGASWPLPNAALAPMGDPVVYEYRTSRGRSTYLLVPIRTAGTTGGSYVVILTDRLDYVTSVRLPEIDYITWVAVDGKGCLYTSQFGNTVAREPEVRELFRYVVDWNAIARRETVTPRAPERIPLSAGFHNVRGGEIAPSGLTLYLVAEGIHAIDLRDGSLIRSSTNGGSCFDFRFTPSEGERPAGLTIWDTEFRDARITGQLHVIVRDDDRPSQDEIRIKHYTAGPSCP